MWYWFCLVASVTLVIGAVAAILLWAWRQETASRYADTLDRRFAKDKMEPEPLKAYLDWVDWRRDLDERVAALEDWVLIVAPILSAIPFPDSSPDIETQADPQSTSNTLSPSLSVKVDGR